MSVGGFAPLIARTRTIHRPVGPVAYDCVKLIVIRSGSAFLFSEFGKKPVGPGDVVLLGANVLCGSEPEGHVTVTTIYADTDFLLDQLFWQYADILRDRLDAQGFADTIYTEPAQVLRLGEDRTGMLMPWLDELVALSVDGVYRERFHRMQALWHAVIDQVAPFIRITPYRTSPHQRARLRPTLPRDRRFTPLRVEARQARDALHSDIARGWGLSELAGMVHLSTKQLGGDTGVTHAVLDDGSTVRAELVVAAIGGVPATAWLRGSGLPISHGVVVGRSTMVAPGVVAAGDVVRAGQPLLGGEPARLEHYSNAMEQGARAARALLGTVPVGDPPVPSFWTHLYDWRLQSVGFTGAAFDYRTVDVDGSDRFVGEFRQRGRLVGAVTNARPHALVRYREELAGQLCQSTTAAR